MRRPTVFRVFRLAFFGLLAADALVDALARAPPSAFRLSKVPLVFEGGLDWVPTARFVARVYSVVCAAALTAALGPERAYTPAAAVAGAAYGVAYFADAANRFQHKYLLALLLALLPWARDRAWVRRLVRTQLALVYFWTAVAKLADGGLFLEGHFVRSAAPRRVVFDGVAHAAAAAGVDDDVVWRLAAGAVVGAELALAALLATGRAPWLAAAVGAAMHLGFEFVGALSIGYFSWYMLALYLLVVPADGCH